MTFNTKLLAPALIALGVFALSPTKAGEHKGQEVEDQSGQIVGSGEDPKYPTPPGPGEDPKYPTPPGSGEDPKYPTPIGSGEDPKYPTPIGSGEDPKYPTPSPQPRPPRPEYDNRHTIIYKYVPNHEASGGNNSSDGVANITCIINGRVIRVRSTRECYMGLNYGNYKMRRQSYKVQKHRDVIVSGGVQGGYAYGGGGYYGKNGECGYDYAPQPMIRYYKPASRAAMMQTEKRARRAVHVQMDYGYGDSGAGRTYKHRRIKTNAAPMYLPNYNYDQGFVVHYGPTISKDGGY